MLPDPLHPAIVHFPIVLAIFLPVVAFGCLWAARRRPRPAAAWLPAAALAVLALAAALAARQTGEAEEDRVENVVAERFIEEHEEHAEALLWGLGVAAALALLGFAPGTTGQVFRGATVAAALVAAVLVSRVGHSGGELVYKHGAAAAYAGGAGQNHTWTRDDDRWDDD